MNIAKKDYGCIAYQDDTSSFCCLYGVLNVDGSSINTSPEKPWISDLKEITNSWDEHVYYSHTGSFNEIEYDKNAVEYPQHLKTHYLYIWTKKGKNNGVEGYIKAVSKSDLQVKLQNAIPSDDKKYSVSNLQLLEGAKLSENLAEFVKGNKEVLVDLLKEIKGELNKLEEGLFDE